MAQQEISDIIVLLPGILGSTLKKEGRIVWGFSVSTIAKALFTGGETIAKDLALSYDDIDVDDLGDGIVADSLLPDLHLIPGIWKIDGYSRIVETITSNFKVTEGKNFFQFPYDWRRDNRYSARKLAKEAHIWLSNWKESSGNSDAKLILVCHSMGGLVSRYFLECLEGWKDTKALVTFGTPYRGSLNALDGLSNGIKKGPLELSDLVRQLTSLYQLLPIFECYDSGDGKLMRVGETSGIPNVNPVKAAAALKFHREIETAVKSNQFSPQYQSAKYDIYPVVGTAQQTKLSAKLIDGTVELLETIEGKAIGGDGTVPRFSAIPIELSEHPTSSMYAGTQHGSLQNADAVLRHLIGILSGLDLDLGAFKKSKGQVALKVNDVYLPGESLVVRARPSQGNINLKATLWHSRDTKPVSSVEMKSTDSEWLEVNFDRPGPGAYRVIVSSDDVEPVEDSFIITDFRGASREF